MSGFNEREFWKRCEEYDSRPEVAAAQHRARERARAADERARKILAGYLPSEIDPDARAPQVTVEALVFDLRERGAAALNIAANRERLSKLSPKQIDEVIMRLANRRAKFPVITDDLLLLIDQCS